jgi:hypothetical protein
MKAILVILTASVLVGVGLDCIQKDAVQLDPKEPLVDADAQADVSGIRTGDKWDDRHTDAPTSQQADAAGDSQTAGNNARQMDVKVPVNTSGSGWPLVAALAIAGLVTVSYFWLREHRQHARHDRERHHALNGLPVWEHDPMEEFPRT